MKAVEWVYKGEEEEVKLWIFRKYKILDALYEAIVMYREKRKKYPLCKCREFVSKVVSFWISVAPILGLDRKKALGIAEMKTLSEKLKACFEMYFTLGDKLKEKGILDLRKEPKFGTRKKAEGMILGYS